jgi:ferredoxin-NADP reductase
MAIIKKYPARVVNIINPIEGVYTLEFESLGKPFKYESGQFLHLAIDEYDPSGQWPESRCFSLQSSPSDERIKITYAVKGSFTKRMAHELKVGSCITVKLPYGDLFTQPHNKTNTIFIAGGTGITPFLSLFTDESFKEYINPHIYLGFRSKAYNIYEAELNSLELCENFAGLCKPKIFYQDIDGIIDIQSIFKENDSTSYYFISGPPIMIKTFKNYLLANGVAVNQILTDDWE